MTEVPVPQGMHPTGHPARFYILKSERGRRHGAAVMGATVGARTAAHLRERLLEAMAHGVVGAEERKEGGELCQHNHAFVDLPEVSLFEQQQLRRIFTPAARSLVTLVTHSS